MDKEKDELIASERLRFIGPLLDKSIEPAVYQQLKRDICLKCGRTDRTIRRWLARYDSGGFAGLKRTQTVHEVMNAISEEIITEAIALRRELPKRSVRTIISILEMEGKIAKGSVKRSTLQEQLVKHGYSSRQMRTYAAGVPSSRRYQKLYRNKLWQADIKYGPLVGNEKTYMVCFIDDCTRMIMHSEFYTTLDQAIVQDCFRKALAAYGLPESVYYDNGSQFKNHWMSRACDKLGIRLFYAKPYSPEGKGKQERFNQTIDAFIEEVKLYKDLDIDKLNRNYRIWLEEVYFKRPHYGIDGKSPLEAYKIDTHELKYADPEKVAKAFLSSEFRKVDKSGCISFQGKKYELDMGLQMIHKRIAVIYDPRDVSEVSIECDGVEAGKGRPLVIGEHSARKPKLPERLTETKPDGSRLLNAAEKQNQEHREANTKAVINYSALQTEKEDKENV